MRIEERMVTKKPIAATIPASPITTQTSLHPPYSPPLMMRGAITPENTRPKAAPIHINPDASPRSWGYIRSKVRVKVKMVAMAEKKPISNRQMLSCQIVKLDAETIMSRFVANKASRLSLA